MQQDVVQSCTMFDVCLLFVLLLLLSSIAVVLGFLSGTGVNLKLFSGGEEE